MKYTLAIVAMVFFSCSYPSPKAAIIVPAKVIDTSKYCIRKFDKAKDGAFFGPGDTATDLSFDDIVKIEKLITIKVANYNHELQKQTDSDDRKLPDGAWRGEPIDHPEKYYKQFLAVVNSKREKVVWVLCFCSPEEKRFWKKFMATVYGGGDCFFQVEINLTTNTILQFNVNGPK